MLEGYIKPWLISQLQNYVENLSPSDVNFSLWGGDLVLKNLQLQVSGQMVYRAGASKPRRTKGQREKRMTKG